METRTEQAAKMLMCPLMTTPGSVVKCQGCDCMAWTWDNDGFEYSHSLKTDRDGKLVRDGSAGDMLNGYLAAGWEIFEWAGRSHVGVQNREIVRRPLPHGRTGFCSALAAKVAELEVG